jgi:hypothetical protein
MTNGCYVQPSIVKRTNPLATKCAFIPFSEYLFALRGFILALQQRHSEGSKSSRKRKMKRKEMA